MKLNGEPREALSNRGKLKTISKFFNSWIASLHKSCANLNYDTRNGEVKN